MARVLTVIVYKHCCSVWSAELYDNFLMLWCVDPQRSLLSYKDNSLEVQIQVDFLILMNITFPTYNLVINPIHFSVNHAR